MEQSSKLKEDDIRPDYLMQGQSERFAADIQRMLRRKNEFVVVKCPACDTGVAHKAFEKYELTYVLCDNCETMYINPRPSPAVLEMYYATSENYGYWNKYIFPASEGVRREKIFRPRAERLAEICQRYHVGTNTLLEVGSGYGIFCEEMQQIGLFERVIAVEPTPDLAATCRHKGLEVLEKPVERLGIPDESIDVVASFEVIEHLFSPRDFVTQCAHLLKPGGIFVVTCPNVKGFDIVVLQDLSSAVDPEHLNYFHPESLSQLVESCGFDVLEVQTPGKLDAELVRKKALTGEIDLSSQPFLHQLLVDDWQRVGDQFQIFLAQNNLSSHMWLVAQKN